MVMDALLLVRNGGGLGSQGAVNMVVPLPSTLDGSDSEVERVG
jgi:hypothetical protein